MARTHSSKAEDALAALMLIKSLLPAHEPEAARAIGDSTSLCEQYARIRPFLDRALYLVELIPVYGAPIAGIIRLLSAVADRACDNVAGEPMPAPAP
jgi:hypothetical protein